MEIKKMTRADKADFKKSLERILSEAEEQHIQPGALMDKKIREGLSGINLNVKQETAEQYRVLFNAKLNKNPGVDLVSSLLECGTRNSFDKTRSAFRFCITEEIIKLTKESDTARKSKNYDLMKQKTIEAYEKYFLFEKEFLSDNRVVWNDISYNKKQSASKKKTMKNADSIDDIFSRLKGNQSTYDRYAMFLSICSVTGCRPSEVLKGIEINKGKGEISFKIAGAKVGENRGQSERKIHLDLTKYSNNEQMNYILSQLKSDNLFYKADKKLYNSLRQYLYIQHRDFSLYTLRHRVASDLKAVGVDDFTIAAFLGHRVTQSQEFYGYARSGSGGVAVNGVECSDAIKANKSQFAVAVSKSKISAKIKNHLKR